VSGKITPNKVARVVEALLDDPEAEPGPVANARRQLEASRERLVHVLSELRGIDCDLEVVSSHLSERPGDPKLGAWIGGVEPDLSQALVAVVDLLTSVQFGLGQLDRWKAEHTDDD